MPNSVWNNFHGWFPGDFYRPLANKVGGRGPGLMADLDRVIAEQNFDLPRFQELIQKTSDYFNEYKLIFQRAYQQEERELTPEEEQKIAELKILETEANRQLDEILTPVAERVMSLGYSKLELIR